MTSSSLRDVPITIVRCSRSVSFVVSFVKDCEKQLKEADDCFKQCDIETRMLPVGKHEGPGGAIGADGRRRCLCMDTALRVGFERTEETDGGPGGYAGAVEGGEWR